MTALVLTSSLESGQPGNGIGENRERQRVSELTVDRSGHRKSRVVRARREAS
jgi:hypothetical protein